MKIKTCKYCNLDCSNMNLGQFANHRRWCEKNPKVEEYRKKNSESGKSVGNKRFGEIQEFEVKCEVCHNVFITKERELLFPKKEHYFCSRKCANAIGGRAKSNKYHTDDTAKYNTVAWRHHEKKCVVCGEDKIVAVHHLDCVHTNNDPKNLVPLCPTHHQYMHSRYKNLVEEFVYKYIKTKWG